MREKEFPDKNDGFKVLLLGLFENTPLKRSKNLFFRGRSLNSFSASRILALKQQIN